MRILLIRPKPHKETIGLQNVMICEPLELEYVSAYLSKHGHDVTIVDKILERKSVAHFVKKYKPDMVGLTGYISHVNVIKKYAEEIKKVNKDIIVCVGGVHAEVCPEDFSHECIDYVLKANALDAFLGIADNRIDMTNILEKEKSQTFCYPFPDREKVKKYRKKYYYMFHRNCTLIKTSFGCPYNCSFCFCREITDNKYFARSVEDIINELKTIKEEEVYIVDDNFLFNANRLNHFCDMLEKENIKKRYLVYGRADFIAENEEVVKRLKDNGLRAVIVGLESCDDKMLEGYNKKSNSKINEKAVAILKKHNIECYGTFILGIDWDREDFKKLKEWIKKLGITFVNLQPFTPLPGTDMYDLYKDKLIVKREEYEKWDMAHLVVRPTKISVRKYYLYTILLYYSTMVNPKKSIYMIKKYGLMDTLKLSIGAFKVNMQYLKKFLKG
ncbi:MAG TPA: radical SAM protein [Clostridiaceae bacterium]|jgi:radical SAM superfamily enzyme YgiQ (UPF0313 family)|nr:radical SAM protein [Clostridiaceae bacterium]